MAPRGLSTPPSTKIPSTSQSPAPVTAAAAGAETPTVGRASTDRRLQPRAGPTTGGAASDGAAPDGAAAGSGAVTTVVDDGKIAASGAKPAPVRFWHRWRRS